MSKMQAPRDKSIGLWNGVQYNACVTQGSRRVLLLFYIYIETYCGFNYSSALSLVSKEIKLPLDCEYYPGSGFLKYL